MRSGSGAFTNFGSCPIILCSWVIHLSLLDFIVFIDCWFWFGWRMDASMSRLVQWLFRSVYCLMTHVVHMCQITHTSCPFPWLLEVAEGSIIRHKFLVHNHLHSHESFHWPLLNLLFPQIVRLERIGIFLWYVHLFFLLGYFAFWQQI